MEEVWQAGWYFHHEGVEPVTVSVGEDPQRLVELFVVQLLAPLAMGLGVSIGASRVGAFICCETPARHCYIWWFPDCISTEANHSNFWPFEPPS